MSWLLQTATLTSAVLGAIQADSVDLWGGVDWAFVDRIVAHKV